MFRRILCLGARPVRFHTGAVTGILLLLALFARAASPKPSLLGDKYSVEYWLREDGLPLNGVSAVAQTRDGYVWIGTYGGLSRFNGIRFARFDAEVTPGLASSRVTALFEADDGALWIGYEGGEVTCYRAGRFETRPRKTGLGQKIVAITSDEHGDVWLLNSEDELIRDRDGLLLRPERGRLRGFKELTRSRLGSMWVACDGRVSQLHGGELTPLDFPEGEYNQIVSGVAGSRLGGVWLMADNRLRRWQSGTWQEERGSAADEHPQVFRMIERGDGSQACGLVDAGFAIWTVGGTMERFDPRNGFQSE